MIVPMIKLLINAITLAINVFTKPSNNKEPYCPNNPIIDYPHLLLRFQVCYWLPLSLKYWPCSKNLLVKALQTIYRKLHRKPHCLESFLKRFVASHENFLGLYLSLFHRVHL